MIAWFSASSRAFLQKIIYCVFQSAFSRYARGMSCATVEETFAIFQPAKRGLFEVVDGWAL
jgi:hypothetical protein